MAIKEIGLKSLFIKLIQLKLSLLVIFTLPEMLYENCSYDILKVF